METETKEASMNCLHTGCLCAVEQAQQFCGEYCREHAADTEHADHACACGHAECQL